MRGLGGSCHQVVTTYNKVYNAINIHLSFKSLSEARSLCSNINHLYSILLTIAS